MNELVNEEEFLKECLIIFEAIYYLKGNFGVLDYYAITDINFKELLPKYRELSKKHPEYRVSSGVLAIVRDYNNQNFFNYLSGNATAKLLRSKSSINGIKIDEKLVKKVKYELDRRGYQNYTFNLNELDLPYGLLYEAIVEVIQNNSNYECLNKNFVLNKLEKKVKIKQNELNSTIRKMPISLKH